MAKRRGDWERKLEEEIIRNGRGKLFKCIKQRLRRLRGKERKRENKGDTNSFNDTYVGKILAIRGDYGGPGIFEALSSRKTL